MPEQDTSVLPDAAVALAKRRHPLLSQYREESATAVLREAQADIEAVLPYLSKPGAEGEGTLRDLERWCEAEAIEASRDAAQAEKAGDQSGQLLAATRVMTFNQVEDRIRSLLSEESR